VSPADGISEKYHGYEYRIAAEFILLNQNIIFFRNAIFYKSIQQSFIPGLSKENIDLFPERVFSSIDYQDIL
jgi:hypothetical protein